MDGRFNGAIHIVFVVHGFSRRQADVLSTSLRKFPLTLHFKSRPAAHRATKGTGEKFLTLILARFVRRLPQCLEINKSSPYSNQHLPRMLVSRADVCPSEGEQRRKTSCNVAMPCGSYCLKNSSQHPKSDQAKYHKRMALSMVWYLSKVAALP